MARHAQRHQIVFVVCAAVGDWFYVMDKFGIDIFILSFAQLAQRILTNVSVAYLLPCAAVAFFVVIAASEFVVMPLHGFFVVVAKAAFVVGQFWTADKAAGAFRFLGHRVTPFGQQKSPRRLMRRRLHGGLPFSASIPYHKVNTDINMTFFANFDKIDIL